MPRIECLKGHFMRGKTFIDNTGIKFNSLTAIKLSEKRGSRGEIYWDCKCDCGKETTVRGDTLRKGRIRTCGCSNTIDLIGHVFHKLTVTGLLDERTKGICHGEKIWLCKCECGKETTARTSVIQKSKIKSCGCIRGRKQNGSYNWKGYGDISATFWYSIT